LDYTANNQRADFTFTFTAPVTFVSFRIGDIDRYDPTTNYYMDEVTITGSDGVVTYNPSISKYDAVTDPDFILISGNRAWVNTAANTANICSTDLTDQRGTINVNFGSQVINSFTIRYRNVPGSVMADPLVQNIALGNVSFVRVIPVPVHLLAFDGAEKDGKVELKWRADNEQGFSHYVVEKSLDGENFIQVGQLPGKGSGAHDYSFADADLDASRYYYRLRMVDLDGSFSFSRMLTVKISFSKLVLHKLYPTIFSSILHVELSSPSRKVSEIVLVGMNGQTLIKKQFVLSSGFNHLPLSLPSSIPPGNYILCVNSGEERLQQKLVKM
jgi:hypothetical protein